MVVLDTNILIYYAAGDQQARDFILGRLENGEEILVPTVVVIEFLSYPDLSVRHRAFFTRLLQQLHIVNLDLKIALRAADLRSAYHLKLGDSVVAATALVAGVALVTRNVRDFRKIPKLNLISL